MESCEHEVPFTDGCYICEEEGREIARLIVDAVRAEWVACGSPGGTEEAFIIWKSGWCRAMMTK